MEFQLKNKLEELHDYQIGLIGAALDTVQWSCLYSGLGIIDPLSKRDLESLGKLEPDSIKSAQLLADYVPICCMYEKGVPIFAPPVKTVLNPGRYMWGDHSRKSELLVESQAYAIISLSRAYHILGNQYPLEKALFYRTARLIYEFTTSCLRAEDGMYANAVDKSKHADHKKKIQPLKAEPNLYDQIIMLEAALSINQIVSDNPPGATSRHVRFYSGFQEAQTLLTYIDASRDLLIDQDTDELADISSSLCRSATKCVNPVNRQTISLLIHLVIAELCARTSVTGEIERSISSPGKCSVQTSFKAMAALLEAHRHTASIQARDTALRLFHCAQDLYDQEHHVFHDCMVQDVRYTIDKIAEVLKALFLHYRCTNHQHSLRLFKEFCYSTLVQGQLIHTNSFRNLDTSTLAGQSSPDSEHSLAYINDAARAPVLLKGLHFSFNNATCAPTTSKTFSSRHSLHATLVFLHYLDIL